MILIPGNGTTKDHYASEYKRSGRCNSHYVGGCQIYGPFLCTLNNRCRFIIGTQIGAIFLTTTHVAGSPWVRAECVGFYPKLRANHRSSYLRARRHPATSGSMPETRILSSKRPPLGSISRKSEPERIERLGSYTVDPLKLDMSNHRRLHT